MNLGKRYNLLFYALTIALLLIGTLAIPGVDVAVGNLVGLPLSTLNTQHLLHLFGPLVLNLYGILLVGFVVNLSIGLNEGFVREVLDSWASLHSGLRRLLGFVFMLLVLANLLSLVNFLELAPVSEESRFTKIIQNYFGFVSMASINFLFMLVFAISVAFGHSRLPAWKRIQVPDKVNRGSNKPGSATLMLSSKDRKLLRKAERLIEKEKLTKAAKIFEHLGDEFYYRAGKFYSQKGLEQKASKAFARAGEYYLQRGNFPRAADAYYYGRQWRNAAQTYERFIERGHMQDDAEQVQRWVNRWGESLCWLERYADAAKVYAKHGFHKKAGEAYERAGIGTEAAASYNKAGAFDSSYKALERTGHDDLAKLEKARYLMKEARFAEAGELFEMSEDYEQAAKAFSEAGVPSRAAKCHAKHEDWEAAAKAYIAAGEELSALDMYEKQGLYKKAASLAAELGVRDKQAYYYRKSEQWVPAARSYIMAGDMDAARKCFRQVDLKDEETVAQCATILDLLFEQERLKDAIACAKGLLEGKKPRRLLAPLLFCLARIYERLGNAEEMINFYFKAANLAQDNPTYKAEAVRVGQLTGVPYTPKQRPENSEPASGQMEPHPETPPTDVAAPAKQQASADVRPVQPKRPAPVFGDEKAPAAASPMRDKPYHTDADDQGEITLTLDEQTVFDLTQDGALQRYQVIKELGKGGMGYVYKARDKKLKRFVALKMLYPEFNNDTRVLLFFKREAMAVASLNHPNLVHLFDAGQEKGCFYMIMEYVEGSNLQQLLAANRGFVERNMIAIWYQACLGLKYAHEHGIIHRDIKPSNIMLARDRRVKVLDFGLAKEATDLSQTQQVWGTPSFMAPEMFQGERASFQTDIYGLGATFYMMACGQSPFTKADLAHKLKGNGLPRPPHEINPKLSPELSKTILRCMYLNPAERYESMDELLKRIRALGRKKRQ